MTSNVKPESIRADGTPKVCFVISPISEEGSEIRRNADTVLKQLVEPAAKNQGLRAVRADGIRGVGQITTQMLRHIQDSDIVVADVTGLNANVFYELAFRHSLGKPAIVLSPKGQRLPFDIADTRAVVFDLSDWTSLETSRELLEDQLASCMTDSKDAIRNPISSFFAVENIVAIQNDPIAQVLVRVNGFLEGLDDRLGALTELASADWRTNAEYIDGQDDAFEALTRATRDAKFSVRSSRFFPASITRRPDYLQAIEERVRGSAGRPAVQEYRRIIALNNLEKKQDVIQHLVNFAARPFQLFLTQHENNFELVVIDDTDVFIHFAKEELVIASTLHLRGRRIAERFTEVFDQLATRDVVAVFDCSTITSSQLSSVLNKVEKLFGSVFGESPPSENPED